MELPPDAPRLPKLPFIAADLVLLAVAGFIAYSADSPLSPTAIISIVVCTGIGVGLGITPFLIDYARGQDERLDERQNSLESLVRSTSAAADQASIAASGLHEIAETTKRNLRTLEELPANIASARSHAAAEDTATLESQKIDLQPLMASIEELRTSQARQLSALAGTLQETQGKLGAIETELKRQRDDLAKVSAATESAVAGEAKTKPRTRKKKSAETPPEPSLFTSGADEAPPSPASDSPVSAASPPAPSAPKSAPKPRSKKPKAKSPPRSASKPESPPAPSAGEHPPVVEEPSAAAPTEEADAAIPPEEPPRSELLDSPPPDSTLEPVPAELEEAGSKDSGTVWEEPSGEEEARSADGFTRLTVTAYIGIGNRLFVRGNGPGLSPDEGTPLQFVSIGKWRWESAEVTEPITLTLWKNDQDRCDSLGEITLSPGGQREVNASF